MDHRKDVVTHKCIFELRKAEARAHILGGTENGIGSDRGCYFRN